MTVVVVSSGHNLSYFYAKKDFVFLILTGTYNSKKPSHGQRNELYIEAH